MHRNFCGGVFLCCNITNGNFFRGRRIRKPQVNVVWMRHKLRGGEILIKNAVPCLDCITILICAFHHTKNPFIICRCLFLMRNCNAHFLSSLENAYDLFCFPYCRTERSLACRWLSSTWARSALDEPADWEIVGCSNFMDCMRGDNGLASRSRARFGGVEDGAVVRRLSESLSRLHQNKRTLDSNLSDHQKVWYHYPLERDRFRL